MELQKLLCAKARHENCIECIWEHLKSCINEATEKHIGKMKKETGKEWYNKNCKELARQKNKMDENEQKRGQRGL